MVSRTFTLGRYTCVERLGTSPIGELWRAKRFGLAGVERQLLLTRLHPSLAKDPQVVARLQAALKSYSEFEHSGLLRLLDHNVGVPASGAGAGNPGELYWATEFVGYADLRKLRAGIETTSGEAGLAAQLPTVVAQIGLLLSMALGEAHERGLCHGLLTPQGVWLDDKGQVRLGELGMSAVLPRTAWASDPNVKAIEKFLAPEVLAGQPATPESDVFSLGALLRELLGDIATRATGDAVRPAQALESVTRRAQAQSPSERYSSMRDLQQAFATAAGSAHAATRALLSRIGQQFLLGGDTVPQPVTISERSSAEPLPPPPTGRVVVGKPAAGAATGRVVTGTPISVKPSGTDAKKTGRDGPSAVSGGASKATEAARPDERKPAGPPPESVKPEGQKVEQEDTPLPASRSLLATDPRLRAANPAAADAEKAGDASAKPDSSRPNRPSGPQRVSSGLEWLTSSPAPAAGGGRVTGPQPTSPSGPKRTAASATPSRSGQRTSADIPTMAAEKTAPEAPIAPRMTLPGTPQKRSPASVSINPRARFGTGVSGAGRVTPTDGGGAWQPNSANTPTADVEPPPEELEWMPETASAAPEPTGRPGTYSPLASGTRPLTDLAETRQALAPIKIPPQVRSASSLKIDEEPTSQMMVDAKLLAQTAARSDPPEPAASGGFNSIDNISTSEVPSASLGSYPPPGTSSSQNASPIVNLDGPNLDGSAEMNQSSSESYALRSTGLQEQVAGEAPAEGAPPAEEVPVAVEDTPAVPPSGGKWLGLVAVAAIAALLTVGIAYKFLLPGGSGTTGAPADAGTTGDGGAGAVAAPTVSQSELPLTTKPVATVFVDGKDRGQSPLTLKLTPGPHKLLLVAEGYKLLRKESPGGQALSLTLEKAVLPEEASGDGKLKVKCKTKGTLRILFDGHDTGATCPADVDGVAPGKHTVGFLDPASDELREKAVKVKKKGKETKVSVKF